MPRVFLCALALAMGLLTVPPGAAGACLRLDGESGRGGRWPVEAGEEVRLRFRHSVYGSLVEEQFRVEAAGFRLVRLRYAERRLAEFYGRETVRSEGGAWVVEDGRRWFPSLLLRVSRESEMQLVIGERAIALRSLARPEGVLRLSVGGCEGGLPAKAPARRAMRGGERRPPGRGRTGAGPPEEERGRHAGRCD